VKSMPRSLGILLVGCAMIAGGFTGCAGGGGVTRFFLLTPLPPLEQSAGAAPRQALTLGLRPVQLPEYLDRSQIVTRAGENMLQLAELDQWASPLREDVTRVLAADLASLVPAERVVVFPWPRDYPLDYEVSVEVTRFDGTPGGACALLAQWTIFRPGGKDLLATGRFSHTEPAGPSFATLVAAESRLLATLGRDVATAIAAIPR
jgi:uncharacterized lipoprotein YmbA